MTAYQDERPRKRRGKRLEERYLTVLDGRGGSLHTLRTYRAYYRSLREFTGTGPKHWQREDIEDWMSHLRHERGNGAKTVAVKLAAVRGLCRWMLEEGIRTDDPCQLIRSPRPPRRLPRPALESAVAALLREDDPTIRMSVALARYAGLRRAEIAGLRWSDLTPDTIWVTVGAKGGHRRAVGIHPELRRALMAHPQQGETVICQTSGVPYTPDSLSNLVRPAMRRAGLGAGQSLHALRHSFATSALEGGAELSAIGSVMGHVSVATTQGYAAVSEQRRREVIAAIRPAG